MPGGVDLVPTLPFWDESTAGATNGDAEAGFAPGRERCAAILVR